MKKVFLALAAVVALAACSKEETIIADKGAAIGFDTFVENSTRSVDDKSLNNDNLANFGVFGTVTKEDTALIFNNVEVTGSDVGQDATWSYSDQYTQYWIAGATYNFAAVAPYGAYTSASYADATTTVEFVNNGVTDLLYAEATAIVGKDGSGDPTAPANGKVAFSFRHVLSKIKFSFENQYNASGSSIAVRNIMLTNAHQTATATLNASTAWALGATTFEIPFGDAETVNNDNLETIAQGSELESYNARFIIPSAVNYTYVVSFDVDIVYGSTVVETYHHTANVAFAPAAGTSYDIKTIIKASNIDPTKSQEPIEFTVTTVNEWGTDNTSTEGIINPAQNN